MEGLKDRRDYGEAARDLAERLGLHNREHQLEQLLEGFGNACDGQPGVLATHYQPKAVSNSESSN